MSRYRTSRRAACVAGLSFAVACGEPQVRPPARVAPAPAVATAAPAANKTPPVTSDRERDTPAPFPEPENAGPRTFWVLGPFPVPVPSAPAPDNKGHLGLARDYLTELGGELQARVDGNTKLTSGGAVLGARQVALDETSTLDLVKLFGGDTGGKVAYAYNEWTVPQAGQALALFGSDDAAVVWLNGQEIHRVIADRAINPESDRFDLPLQAGTNRLLVKVDNGYGGWAFALRVLDGEGRRRFEAREARRHLDALELGPASGKFRLDASFPDIVFRDSAAAARAFGKNGPRVRWFGPDLREVQSPGENGAYTAVVEVMTLDGYRYRSMLTFAKVPESAMLRFRAPPFLELPLLPMPGDPPMSGEAPVNDAQRAELSRHLWHGGVEALSRGQHSAEAVLALLKLGQHPPPPDEPLWLSSGFIQAAEHRLKLRLALEGRTPKPLAPPERLTTPAPELRGGSEAQAGVRPGTVARLRAVARDWARADKTPFVVLVARHGVVFLHEGWNGLRKDAGFRPASLGKMIAGLTFARAVDQGLLQLDQPVGSVLGDWQHEHTGRVTFRQCFLHVTGLAEHASHGGLYNAYLDNALLVEDAAFARPGTRFQYNGDDINLVGKALEMVTGQSIWRLLYENIQRPFGEPVRQFDLGFGDWFTAMYLAKVGQMILQDGSYGRYRFYKAGFLESLRPRRVVDFAPGVDDPKREGGVGFEWMPDPPGAREGGVLGPNVIGHGASTGVTFRVDKDHDLVVVVGRSGFRDGHVNEEWTTKFVKAVSQGIPPR